MLRKQKPESAFSIFREMSEFFHLFFPGKNKFPPNASKNETTTISRFFFFREARTKIMRDENISTKLTDGTYRHLLCVRECARVFCGFLQKIINKSFNDKNAQSGK